MDHELDAGDLDAIRELRALPGQALVFERISDQISLRQQELERPADQDRTSFLRGEIAGLRTALGIPEIIEDEARGNVESLPLRRYAKEKQHGR